MKFFQETSGILISTYSKKTSTRTKLIDLFIFFNVLLTILQLAYEKIVTDYPFNSFLAGFYCTLGIATLTACLRTQVENTNSTKTDERAYFEYLICCLILYLVVFNFLG